MASSKTQQKYSPQKIKNIIKNITQKRGRAQVVRRSRAVENLFI
jgi:hypothetical protein